MINYANEQVEYSGCPTCAFSKHEFSLPCGMAYEDKNFLLSQDWELPIPGFFVIAPKRHMENFNELTQEERKNIFEIINKTIDILKDAKVCDRFNVIFEEKLNSHFHIWIMPRFKWMEQFGSISKNIGLIFQFAINNMKTEENLKKINEINQIVNKKLKNFKI